MYHTLITKNFPIKLNRRRPLERINILFLLTVVIPTLVATIYFAFLASDVYISQSQFVVRSPDKPAATGIGMLLKSAGFSNAGDEIFATQDYILSRDALRTLNRNKVVEIAYTRPEISLFNRLNPLGFGGTFEDLYDFYRNKVSIEHDATSSITTLSVKAFTAADALRFNQQLLEQAESLVNRLNRRGQSDLVQYAEREAKDAQLAGLQASQELARYRNLQGVIDPERQATVQLQMVSKLQDELIGARTQLSQLRSLAPENPQIPLLETRVAALAREIDGASGQVAGDRSSLSATAVRYQRLQLEREYADRRLTAALASLQEARNEARRKQAYVERIVQPDLPDEAQQPRRLRGIFATFILGLIAFGILTMLLAGIREHQD
jgi:capsular polysaccharide transport system permease protein